MRTTTASNAPRKRSPRASAALHHRRHFSLKKNTTLLSFVFSPPFSLQAAPNNLAHRAQGPAAAAATASSDPEAAPYTSGYGDESKGKLHGGGHKGGAHSHHHSAFGGLPPALDSHSLDKLKHQALAKARAVQSSLIAAVKSGSSGGIGGGRAAAAPTSQSSHGGFGVVVPPAPQAAARAAGAPDAALSAFTAKLGRLCDKVESSRATALACR